MRLYVDADNLTLIRAENDLSRVTQIEQKRGDSAAMEIIFIRSGARIEHAAGTVVKFAAKEEGKFDADVVVFEDGFTLTNSGASPYYLGSPSFNTVDLDALLNKDADETNDKAFVDLIGEISWGIPVDNAPTSTRTFRVRVHNDVIRDDEGAPDDLPAPDAFVAARAILFDRAQSLSAAEKTQALENLGLPGKNNYAATAAPTVADDSSAGYGVGSLWIDVTNDEAYRLIDATEGAAVWIESTLDATEVATIIEGKADKNYLTANSLAETDFASAYPHGISYMHVDQDDAWERWRAGAGTVLTAGQSATVVTERMPDGNDGFTGRQSVYLSDTNSGSPVDTLIGQRTGGEDYWTAWDVPAKKSELETLEPGDIGAETPAGAQAKVDAEETARIAGDKPFSHNLRPTFAALDHALQAGNSIELVTVGDSTGNGDDEFFEVFADHVRDRFPAYRHVQRLFNMTTNQWDTTILNAGTEAYMSWGAVETFAYCSLNQADVPDLTGQFSIEMKMRLTSWDANATERLVQRYNANPHRQWFVRLEAGGFLRIYWYNDSDSILNMVTTVAKTVADGSDIWLRIMFQPDDGAGNRVFRVQESSDGVTYSTIQTVTTAGATTIRTSGTPDPISIGGGFENARIYHCRLFEGDFAKPVSPYFIDAYYSSLTYGPFLTGTPTILTSNFSLTGNSATNLITRLTGAAPAESLFVKTPHSVVLYNCSLNDSNSGSDYSAYGVVKNFNTIKDLYETINPEAFWAVATQNPDTRSAAQSRLQAMRISALTSHAVRNGLGVADFYAALAASATDWDTLIPDGVHPTATAVSDVVAPVLIREWPDYPLKQPW